MVIEILTLIAVIVVVLLGVIARQPGDYRVVRTGAINASPATVFALVNDFHRWGAWSPWEGNDPTMQRDYEGPPAGAGAIYRWSGNKKAGAGQMTIVQSVPADSVRIQLDFTRPFVSSSLVAFSFKPAGSGTAVEWTMTGNNSFMAKGFFMFTGGMEKVVGPDFEKGLGKMKTAAEALA